MLHHYLCYTITYVTALKKFGGKKDLEIFRRRRLSPNDEVRLEKKDLEIFDRKGVGGHPVV